MGAAACEMGTEFGPRETCYFFIRIVKYISNCPASRRGIQNVEGHGTRTIARPQEKGTELRHLPCARVRKESRTHLILAGGKVHAVATSWQENSNIFEPYQRTRDTDNCQTWGEEQYMPKSFKFETIHAKHLA